MNDERTTAYLLNELSKREAEEFEEQCFAQPEWPEAELEAAEDELIIAYITNELSAKRRRRFEKYYLTTVARKDKVLLARSFLRVVDPSIKEDPPEITWKQRLGSFLNPVTFGPWATVPMLAAVVLAISLAVTSAWLAFRPKAPQTFAQLNLAITSENRGTSGQVPKIKWPLAQDVLIISLALPEPAPASTTYRVQWEDVKGPLQDLSIVYQYADSIFVIIPAEKLKPGQYALKLFRKTPDGTEQRVPGNYRFNVE